MLARVCGRYTNTAGVQELNELFGVSLDGEAGTRRYNIAPTEQVLALVRRGEEVRPRLLRWGLVPTWSKSVKGAQKLINARIESVTITPAYRSLIGRGERRALQIADGWFEWLKPERPKQPRQPFYFQVDGGEPFAFAALWTPAKIDGEWLASVALLTCDATPNRVAAAVHGRMPVVLADRDARRAWLDPRLDAQEALGLCGPLPASRLTARPANPAVNKVVQGVEGPELLSAPSPGLGVA